jgi:mannose-6-phosphate isomerase-like protein (cupin superfamily)
VKVQGEFTWHKHPDTDEFFLVLDGELKIQMRECNVVLRPPELFVMPRRVEHCPSADVETAVLCWSRAASLTPATLVES